MIRNVASKQAMGMFEAVQNWMAFFMNLAQKIILLSRDGYYISIFHHPKSTMVIRVRRVGESNKSNQVRFPYQLLDKIPNIEEVIIDTLDELVNKLRRQKT